MLALGKDVAKVDLGAKELFVAMRPLSILK